MPYPIAKLAYGLRRRLHDLATPSERYNIQIAAGNSDICPPVQTVESTISKTTFHYKNGKAELPYFNINKDTTYRTVELWLFFASSQNVTSAPFRQFCGQKLLNLHTCHLSKALFEKLSKLVTAGSIQHFYLYENTNAEYALKMSDLLSVFPKLTKLCVVELSFADTWMSEILEYPQHSITELYLKMTSEQFRSLSADELAAFLKAQKEGFHLTLHLKPDGKLVQFELDLPNIPNFGVLPELNHEWQFSEVPQQYYNNTRLVVQSSTYRRVYFF